MTRIHIGSVLMGLGMFCAAASAGVVIQLGNGWEVEVHDPDHSDITVDSSTLSRITLEKSAEFVDLNPIVLTFRQNLADAATAPRIVLTDEIITNNSGFDWIDFEMILDGPAVFNPTDSAAFSIAPFTTTTYSNGDQMVHFEGGTVPDGGFWFPGLLAGELVMDIDLSGRDPVEFTLTEVPSIPAHGPLALLGLGGLIAARRRR